jgi:hypothetical protein
MPRGKRVPGLQHGSIDMKKSNRNRAILTALAFAALIGASAVSTPAMAREWHDNGHGHGHWDNGRHRGHYKHGRVIERREVIVRDRPVYVAPPPPPVYYAPPANYYQPGFDFFLRVN